MFPYVSRLIIFTNLGSHWCFSQLELLQTSCGMLYMNKNLMKKSPHIFLSFENFKWNIYILFDNSKFSKYSPTIFFTTPNTCVRVCIRENIRYSRCTTWQSHVVHQNQWVYDNLSLCKIKKGQQKLDTNSSIN